MFKTYLVDTKYIDILFSTRNVPVICDFNIHNDKLRKEEILKTYLKEYDNNDRIQLAVIDALDPVFSDIAYSIHSRLIDYNFYGLDDGYIKVSNVNILTPYTVLVRMERLNDELSY